MQNNINCPDEAQNTPIAVILERFGVKPVNVAGSIKYCCPLHNEKTPSATVFKTDSGKELFKCFGCDTCLDSIGLYGQLAGIDPRLEYKRICRELVGLVHIHASSSHIVTKAIPKRQITDLDSDILEDFKNHLAKDHNQERGLKYVLKRHLTASQFDKHFGYVEKYNLAENHLKKRYAIEQLQDVGLFSKKGRLIFGSDYPLVIFTYSKNRIVGVESRTLTPNHSPKYLSQSGNIETSVFANSLAKNVICLGYLHINEGKLDVLSNEVFGNPALCIGITKTVSWFGKNPDFMQKLKDYGVRVIIEFDNDRNGAGQSAAIKLLKYLEKCGIRAEIRTLEVGTDVNDLLAKTLLKDSVLIANSLLDKLDNLDGKTTLQAVNFSTIKSVQNRAFKHTLSSIGVGQSIAFKNGLFTLENIKF